MDDLSVVIQGPLNRISLENLDYYKTLGQVIISHWDDDDVSMLSDDSDIIVTSNALPDNRSYDQPTFDFQVQSVLYGLEKVDTPIVIRTRSDERYGNLTPLLREFEKNTDKVVCGNIFFKRWSDINFHPGDHLFIGKTEILRNAYRGLRNNASKYATCYCAEMSMAHAILDSMDLPVTKDGFIEAFGVVDINLFKPFVAQFRHGGITYVNNFSETCVIKTMEEC